MTFWTKRDSDNLDFVAKCLAQLLGNKGPQRATVEPLGETKVEDNSLESIFEDEQRVSLETISAKLQIAQDSGEMPFYFEDVLNEEERSVLG